MSLADRDACRILHLEPIGGMAGDMFLGALIDLGVPEDLVAKAVAALGLRGVGIETRASRRGGVGGLRFRVLVDGLSLEGPEPEERTTEESGREWFPSEPSGADWDLEGIRGLLRAGSLEPEVLERAERLFGRLAEGLAATGEAGADAVRFTGLAGIDFLVDLVGSAAAVEFLSVERITCGPVNVGGGGLQGAGPGAACLWLLKGAPTYAAGAGERCTPTGAVLLAEMVDSFEPPPPMVLEGVGHGLGRFEAEERPNVVRALLGRPV